MRRIQLFSIFLSLFLLTDAARSQELSSTAVGASGGNAVSIDESTQLRQEVDALKKTLALLEGRLQAQEKKSQEDQLAKEQQAKDQQAKEQQAKATPSPAASDMVVQVKDLDQRVMQTERGQALDRLRFSGDYRFESHSIRSAIPNHYDGMVLQNLLVKTMFAMPLLGRAPGSVAEINNTVAAHPGDYMAYANNLTFGNLKKAMASFPAPAQQQLMGMLLPSAYTKGYDDNNAALYTNRLRLKFDAKVADNVSFTGRLSMYKVFGDSTGVQVFNGQPTSLNIDGTTGGVPNSDQLRVERAYFSWNKIAGSNLYLSIGRRPSTSGPPMTYREDEPRGGTPSGTLIDYQFDGMTVGYNVNENIVLRLCYGLGYESGFGNGNVLKTPADRLKDVHFLGINLDLWNTDTSLVQFTFARAYNVTDGFNGLMVLPNNPISGDAINAAMVMRYTPSANLGAINLAGLNVEHKFGNLNFYSSGNMSATRPNGQTTPFGGLMSDPFDTPVNHSGYMVLAGGRYNFGNDDRTKLGFEFNHGSKYWFNFAQAADDIIAPKTNTRGNVFETYLTHRISERFIFKADLIKYDYRYSGSGWHVGLPKLLSSTPVLGFPTYNSAFMFSAGLITRF